MAASMANCVPLWRDANPLHLVRIGFALVAMFAVALATAARAEYPNKLIHVISPAPPAGSVDIIARVIAPIRQYDQPRVGCHK